MSWTDERIATLKKMWEGGSTASQIADELGGGLGGSGRIGDGRRDVAGAWQHVAGQLLDAMYSLVEAARRSLSLSLSLSHSLTHPPTPTCT